MMEKILTMLVGLLIALGGWSLSRTFELSTFQAVHNNQIDKLERHVEKLQDKMEIMLDKDEEIMQQHKDLFIALENNQPSTGYSYN